MDQSIKDTNFKICKPQEHITETLTGYLTAHKHLSPISFHMPGHKGRSTLYGIYGFGGFVHNMMGADITEIPGADALQQPQGVIKRVMNHYASLYGVLHTELLVNGSSVGLMAAILSTVPRGGYLITGRNSHKSVYSGMRLGGIEPIYVLPEIDCQTGLQGGINPKEIEKTLEKHPEADAVLITSPNYYGVLSDLQKIADIVHKYNKILIVDQAHGAHLKFFDYFGENYRAAENCDADIVVNSIHKTLLSFTGTAILNICSNRIDIEKVSENLRMLQTTSPSYLMMGSLDINEQILRQDGYELIKRWEKDVEYFYKECKKIRGVSLIIRKDMDLTKINLSMSDCGLDGTNLYKELMQRNIWCELVHGDYVMLLTGIGNERGDYEEVLTALREISQRYRYCDQKRSKQIKNNLTLGIPEKKKMPLYKTKVPLYCAEGCIAYDPIVAYPPGSPIICPGEVISRKFVIYIRTLLENNVVVSGVDEEGCIAVSADE